MPVILMCLLLPSSMRLLTEPNRASISSRKAANVSSMGACSSGAPISCITASLFCQRASSPVVLWAGGMFFSKAWRSLVNRSLNMFTLIATGVGAAYFYSAVAVIAPGVFPESFRENGEVGLYFEAAALITVLSLLGQLLETKGLSQTSQAFRALLRPAAKTAHRIRHAREGKAPRDQYK